MSDDSFLLLVKKEERRIWLVNRHRRHNKNHMAKTYVHPLLLQASGGTWSTSTQFQAQMCPPFSSMLLANKPLPTLLLLVGRTFL